MSLRKGVFKNGGIMVEEEIWP